LDAAYYETRVVFLYEFIAECIALFKVVTSVDVDEWEGETCRVKCFVSKVRHDDRVLSTREEKCRIIKLGCGLTEHVNGFSFELLEVAKVIVRHDYLILKISC